MYEYLTGVSNDCGHPAMAVFANEITTSAGDRFGEEVEVVIDGLAR